MARGAICAPQYADGGESYAGGRPRDDQIAFCREVDSREGMTVAMLFEDGAVPASSSINRPGFIATMRAAEATLQAGSQLRSSDV